MDEGREQQEQQAQQGQQENQGQPVDAQRDEAAAFSLKLGGDQPEQGETPPAEQPSQPAQPSQPSQPLTPSAPQFAPYPLPAGTTATPAPSAQPQPPSQPVQPQTPGVMHVLTPSPPRKRGALGRPLPLPVSALIVLGCIALLAAVFGARVIVLHGDWSEGAAAVGTIALALAIAVALVALLRVAAGRRTIGFGLLTLALLVGLTGAGVAGLSGSDSLHSVQAQAMERNGQWSIAIHEYQLTGQKAPNAPDIARVYDAWGEQALAQRQYREALARFQTVLDDYNESGAAIARAQKGQFNTYVAWLKNDPGHLPYHDAIIVFTNYAANSGCDSGCKATLAEVTPQARYLYGEQLLTQKQYERAIAEFNNVTTHYGSSAYAKQAHVKAAQAYYAYGQQQIATQNCGDAVTLYKTLAAAYKDTPEGAKAQVALAAPQDVTGVIHNAPTNPAPTAHLSKYINPSAFYFSDEYSTSMDATGQFIFKHVAPGVYYITTSRPIPGGTEYAWWYDTATPTAYYSFTVTPLCTMQLGGFTYGG